MQDANLDIFEAARAMTLREAISSGRLNIRGRKPTLAVVQRWANPRRGCHPVGESGPQLVLPTVLTSRERLTMPEWVDWFVASRASILVASARKLIVPPTNAELEKRAEAAKARMRANGVKC